MPRTLPGQASAAPLGPWAGSFRTRVLFTTRRSLLISQSATSRDSPPSTRYTGERRQWLCDCCRAYIPEIEAVFVKSNRLNVIILIHVVLFGVFPPPSSLEKGILSLRVY